MKNATLCTLPLPKRENVINEWSVWVGLFWISLDLEPIYNGAMSGSGQYK